MTTIREFSNQAEAALAAAYLQDNEIDAFVADQDSFAYVPGPIVSLRLQVPDEQAEAAADLLAEMDKTLHDS